MSDKAICCTHFLEELQGSGPSRESKVKLLTIVQYVQYSSVTLLMHGLIEKEKLLEGFTLEVSE